jgi:hypothetical protein
MRQSVEVADVPDVSAELYLQVVPWAASCPPWLRQVTARLDVRNRGQAAIVAYEAGLIP